MDTSKYVAIYQKHISTKAKRILSIYAAILFVINMVSTFLLYTHYGPLTPNGNRYYHSFDLSSLSWEMMGLCFIASLALLFPLVKFSRPDMKTILDVFPATSKLGRICSAILTMINIITGTIFSISLLLITKEYLSNHSRVMSEDIETIMLALAYITCFLFWGVIDIICLVINKSKERY